MGDVGKEYAVLADGRLGEHVAPDVGAGFRGQEGKE